MIRDIGEVAAKLASWANTEVIFLSSLDPEVSPNLKLLEESISQLYYNVLKWIVNMLCRTDNKFSRVAFR